MGCLVASPVLYTKDAMALTQQDLDELDAAIASGTLSVRFNGREETFQNTTDLIKARDHVARVLQSQKSRSGPRFGGRSYGLADFSYEE